MIPRSLLRGESFLPVKAIAQTVTVSVSNPQPAAGQTIQIIVSSTISGATQAALFYAPISGSGDPNSMCIYPSPAYTVLSYGTPLNQPFNWTVPAAGAYYVYANILDGAGNLFCTGTYSWNTQSCRNYFDHPVCQDGFTVLRVGGNAPVGTIQLSKSQAETGETVGITVSSNYAGAHHADVYFVPVNSSGDPSQMCTFPSSAYQAINFNASLNQPFNWTVPADAGKYYIYANLRDSGNNPICGGTFSWNDQSCSAYSSLPKCQGTFATLSVGYDILKYWNIKPGNYWIFNGTNHQLNQSSRTRWEIEQKTRACGKNIYSGYPMFMSKENVYGYWGPPYSEAEASGSAGNSWNKNLRFFLGTSSVVHAPFFVDYPRLTNWYGLGPPDISAIAATENGYGYFQTPPFLSDLTPYISSTNFASPGRRAYFIFSPPGQSESQFCNYLPQVDKPPEEAGSGRFLTIESISYQPTVVNTPAYSGPAMTFKQGERGGAVDWTVREDWTFARDIGLVSLKQKTFTVKESAALNYSNNQSLCTDSVRRCWCPNMVAPQPGDDIDCGYTQVLQKPFYEQKLSKYYLGGQLQLRLNSSQTSITIVPGSSFTLKATDPTTNYTYEGYLETNAQFFSPQGQVQGAGKWDVWLDESGVATVNVGNIPADTYTASFRPWIRRDEVALSSGAEQITETANLPWSNPVTVVVQSVTPTPPATPRPTPSPSPSYTVVDLKTLLINYLTPNDSAYQPVESKVNLLDAGWVVRWLGN